MFSEVIAIAVALVTARSRYDLGSTGRRRLRSICSVWLPIGGLLGDEEILGDVLNVENDLREPRPVGISKDHNLVDVLDVDEGFVREEKLCAAHTKGPCVVKGQLFFIIEECDLNADGIAYL